MATFVHDQSCRFQILSIISERSCSGQSKSVNFGKHGWDEKVKVELDHARPWTLNLYFHF